MAILGNKAFFFELVEQSGIEPDEEEDTPQICDHLVRWWHGQPEGERPPADEVAISLGCVVGDFVMHFYNFEWSMLTDRDGTNLVLVGRPPGGGEIIFPAIHSVAKRFEEAPEGFIVEMLDELVEFFGPLLKDEYAGDGEEE
ncbi:MAG: hypothetical protein JSR77_09365 [Planctomycetes bacterium]|nr:hypothetical protein [Planctomycetota bacterium]